MLKPLYYLTKISELKDPQIVRVFVELCDVAQWDIHDHMKHSVFTFLTLYFRQSFAGRVTLKSIAPIALLHQRMDKLEGKELLSFCKELAQLNGKFFEGEENKSLLLFLKGIFGGGVKKRRL